MHITWIMRLDGEMILVVCQQLNSTFSLTCLASISFLQDRRADYVSAILENLVSWKIVESRLTKAVVRAVERDESLRRRILRKQHLAQANGQSRGRPRTRQGRPTGRQGDQEVARSSPVEA